MREKQRCGLLLHGASRRCLAAVLLVPPFGLRHLRVSHDTSYGHTQFVGGGRTFCQLPPSCLLGSRDALSACWIASGRACATHATARLFCVCCFACAVLPYILVVLFSRVALQVSIAPKYRGVLDQSLWPWSRIVGLKHRYRARNNTFASASERVDMQSHGRAGRKPSVQASRCRISLS